MIMHRLIFALLLGIAYNVVESSIADNQNNEDSLNSFAFHIAEDLQTIRSILNKDQIQENLELHKEEMLEFTNAEIKEMELVFELSPQEAQCIINHLQDPTYFPGNENYRSAIFFGEPGSGKTTMAKAIVYKMMQHGWKYKIVSSSSLLGEYRNQTAINLQKEFELIRLSKEPTIIVIDELNRLLENTESKHHDTDTIATTLWTFLDKQKGNKNFFLIGTMNRIHKLPKPYKNRILFNCIHFPTINDSERKNKLLQSILAYKNLQLDQDVTNTFLNEELTRMGSCTGRDLENIATVLIRKNKMHNLNNGSPLIITKISISQVINEYISLKAHMQYDLEDETNEERQERYHIENINVQKKHHEEQLQLQKENQLIQEIHFVQQQLFQKTISENQIIEIGSIQNEYSLSKEGKHKINSILSDEQKRLYEETMINTRAREAKETAVAQEAAERTRKKAQEDANKWFWER